MSLQKEQNIIDFIKNQEIVKVSDLESMTKIPRTSLLRYLRNLENDGKIIKTFGEVKIKNSPTETNPYPRLLINKQAKILIAKKAAKIIKNLDVIFIDGGSTNYYLAKELWNKDITIYTNNLLFSKLLNDNYKPKVNFIPGEINKTTLVAASATSLEYIDNIIFDKVFVGFNAFSLESLATTNESEAKLKKTLIKNAQKNAYIIGKQNKTSGKARYIFANKTDVTIITEQN